MSVALIEPHVGVRRRTAWATLLLVAAAVTALNALKPLTIDDGAYVQYARQISQHPLDPYGFSILWTQWPAPANDLLAPPVLPYWWAIGMRLLGPSVVLWKLWLFPLIFAFVGSAFWLLRRFSPAVALPVTVLVAGLPVYLPGINFMLDIPALALGLLGLCVAISAIDRGSLARALLAGVVFGLALQTKYSVLTLPPIAAVYGLLHRRFRLALVPGMVALLLFVAWETFVWQRYGYSHFLLHLQGSDPLTGTDSRLKLLRSGVSLMGCVGGPVALLMAWALGVGPMVMLFGAVAAIAPFLDFFFNTYSEPAALVFGSIFWAALACGIVVTVLHTRRGAGHRDEQFLLLAFGIEVANFLVVSPFSATRRLMGVTIFLVLIAARLSGARAVPPSRQLLHAVVVVALLCGGWVFAIDTLDALAEKTAVDELVTAGAALSTPGSITYYMGHWGFDFYCNRAGFKPLVPDTTVLHPGDLVAVPGNIDKQQTDIPSNMYTLARLITVDDPLRYTTIPFYYSGVCAMGRRHAPRMEVHLLKMTKEFRTLTTYSDDFIATWALTNPVPLMPMSVPAVLRAARAAEPMVALALLEQIANGGPDAVIEASENEDVRARRWAVDMLRRLPRSNRVNAALRARLADPDLAVRTEAAAALGTR